MPSLFSAPKAPKTKPETPKPPTGLPETGEAEVTKRFKQYKTGRGGTILSGQLAPGNIGRRKVTRLAPGNIPRS